MRKKAKKGTYGWYKNEADRVFSLVVRLSGADNNGFCTCVTCGAVRHYKDHMHAGHFIARNHSRTRYDKRNVHPQCVGCNSKMYGDGKKPEHATYILRRYGSDVLQELSMAEKKTHKLSVFDLKEIIEKCKEELKELEYKT